MSSLQEISAKLQSGISMDAEEASCAAQQLASAEISCQEKAGFLTALNRKGETPVEVAAFAHTFRNLAVDPGVSEWADRAIDVCGTGGDGAGTFNISTAVSFVVAAAGVPVFKHGNRSITSKCGSADLLEAVGIRLDAPHSQIRDSLAELNYCFFFAPLYHPAFKEIMPVRRQLAESGQRSIFNLLGPLINPGRPAHQLLGVFAEHWVAPLAEALASLGLRSGVVAHGIPEAGVALDELSCAGENLVAGFGALSEVQGRWVAAQAGLPTCTLSELKGGEVDANIETLHGLLSGKVDRVSTGLRHSVLLNAGVALWAAGAASDLRAGVALADETLSSGKAAGWLERAKAFYQSGKE